MITLRQDSRNCIALFAGRFPRRGDNRVEKKEKGAQSRSAAGCRGSQEFKASSKQGIEGQAT